MIQKIVVLVSLPVLSAYGFPANSITDAEVNGNSATVKLPRSKHRLGPNQWRTATPEDLAPAPEPPVDDLAADPEQLKLIDPVTGEAVPTTPLPPKAPKAPKKNKKPADKGDR